MADQPLPTTNPIEAAIDQGLSGANSAIVTVIETAIIADAPAMATPVWKQIWEGFLGWIFGTLNKTGQLLITFGINKAQGSLQDSSLQKAATALQAAIASGDQNAIAKATLAFQQAQSAAVNSGGSAHPQ